jgi:predicted Zn-dependent peptidase
MSVQSTARVTTLSNGLRVISEAMPHVGTASLGIWVASGSRAEAPEEHGIAHMLEHMAFKGTENRSARDIAEEIETAGGEINAATGVETTSYFARVLQDEVPGALDVLADILRNPVYKEEDLGLERTVILQEIAATRDNPEDVLFDAALSVAFPDQPLGRPVLGTASSVRNFRRDNLVRFRDANYGAQRMILSAAGAVDHDILVREAERLLSDLPSDCATAFAQPQYRGGYKSVNMPLEQSHVLIAFESPASHDPDFYTAQVCAGLLGGGMSSRLFQEAREQRGLCYAIYAFCSGFSDTGVFGIHAAADEMQAPALMDVITMELRKLAEEGPRVDEVQRAKANMKAGLLMSLESSATRAEFLARHLYIFEKPPEFEKLIAHVESVDPERVRHFVQRLLSAGSPSCVHVGPRADAPELRAIAEGSLRL